MAEGARGITTNHDAKMPRSYLARRRGAILQAPLVHVGHVSTPNLLPCSSLGMQLVTALEPAGQIFPLTATISP